MEIRISLVCETKEVPGDEQHHLTVTGSLGYDLSRKREPVKMHIRFSECLIPYISDIKNEIEHGLSLLTIPKAKRTIKRKNLLRTKDDS